MARARDPFEIDENEKDVLSGKSKQAMLKDTHPRGLRGDDDDDVLLNNHN